MTGDREHHIVMLGIHYFYAAAATLPKRAKPFNRVIVVVGLIRRQRSKDAPAVIEKFSETRFGARFFSASDGMARNQMNPRWHMGGHHFDHRLLDRTYVG